jgi:YfiH family protein
MNRLILPNIFDRYVVAFFTRKSFGENIDKITNILPLEKNNIYVPVQKHTDSILVLGSDLTPKIADAVITQRKDILIGIKVADCVPILLFDVEKKIAGAVHAGWKGTASTIIKKTIKSMNDYFNSSPKDIRIALGPSIRWNCYEVGHDVKNAICKVTGDGDYYIKKDNGKYCIDLASANIYQAVSMGVPEQNIWISNECTYCNPDKYYSYRYEKSYNGSQGGFIGILEHSIHEIS